MDLYPEIVITVTATFTAAPPTFAGIASDIREKWVDDLKSGDYQYGDLTAAAGALIIYKIPGTGQALCSDCVHDVDKIRVRRAAARYMYGAAVSEQMFMAVDRDANHNWQCSDCWRPGSRRI